MPERKFSIAVLDDHSLIVDAISNMVQGSVSYQFAGGFSSSAMLRKYMDENAVPDFLLLDINLDGEDGMLLCRDFLKNYPLMKIVMLTGLSEPAIIKNAIRNGCAGFMLKNMKAEELWDCLGVIMKGERYLHPDVERIMLQSVTEGKTKHADYMPRLSRREKEVLELIVQERTTQEIADTLFISVNTVETHRASLLAKLGARNIAGLVRVALEKGLI